MKLVNAKQRKVRLYLGHDDNDSNEKKGRNCTSQMDAVECSAH